MSILDPKSNGDFHQQRLESPNSPNERVVRAKTANLCQHFPNNEFAFFHELGAAKKIIYESFNDLKPRISLKSRKKSIVYQSIKKKTKKSFQKSFLKTFFYKSVGLLFFFFQIKFFYDLVG